MIKRKNHGDVDADNPELPGKFLIYVFKSTARERDFLHYLDRVG